MALKEFPYPVFMTGEGAVIHDGELEMGQRLASIPFHHAYRGKLTKDIVIRTLLRERALPIGTVVYGFPARSSRRITIGGVTQFQKVDEGRYRDVKLELTWCAPVQDNDPKADKKKGIGRGGWFAACIPYGSFSGHTIINGLQPAFGVTRVSYNAETSSNKGRPPIARSDDRGFDQPLRIDYVFMGQKGEQISLQEQIYFGDELTSSQPKMVYARQGAASIYIAGAHVELTSRGTEGLTAKLVGVPVVGSNAHFKWDRRATLIQQLKKLGITLKKRDVVPEKGAKRPIDSAK